MEGAVKLLQNAHVVHGNITTPILNCNILEDKDYFVFISASLWDNINFIDTQCCFRKIHPLKVHNSAFLLYS